MCGRYYLADFNEEEILEYIRILEELERKTNTPNYEKNVKMRGEIFPSDIVPVIANNKHMQLHAFAMKFGYSLSNGKLIINARSETASQKYMFKDGMAKRRCLIPANYYYEWEKHNSGKIKYAIYPKDKKAMLMAGLYRIEYGFPVFCILTRDTSPDISFIHSRMPVILPKKSQSEWLNLESNADEIIQSAMLDMEHRTA